MTRPTPASPRGLRDVPLLGFVILQSLIIFAVQQRRTLWGDEFNMLLTARKPLREGLLWLQDYSAPLYQLVLRPFLTSDTPPVWLLRAPAFAFSIATVVAAWFFIERLFSRRAALIALCFIVLNPVFGLYSIQARPYTMFAFFSVASMWSFSALFAPRSDRSSALVAWVVSSVLLVYSHYYGFLVLGAQGVFAAIELLGRRDRRLTLRIALAFAAIGVSCLPALWLISRYVRSGNAGMVGWIPRPERTDLLFLRQAGVLFGEEMLAIVCLAAAAFTIWRGDAQEIHPDESPSWWAWWSHRRGALLCALWIGFGLYFLVFVSYAVRPIYVSRYGLPIQVPLAAFLGAALARLRMPWLPLAVGALLTLPAARLLQSDLRDDARDYTHLIEALRAENTDQSPVYVTNLPYLPDFHNTELIGLRYYGYQSDESEPLVELARDRNGQVVLAEGVTLPREYRLFVVAAIGAPAIEGKLQGEGRAYRRQDFGTLTLLEIEKAGEPGRWLVTPAVGDGPAPPRRTAE